MFKLICDSEYAFITPGNISYEVISVNRKIIMGLNRKTKATT